jgi:nitrogenase molybdenum-iron protein alpha chain
MARLAAEGMEFNDYEGMMTDMQAGTLVVDDISHHEAERLIEIYKPDVFCAGIKEKFCIQKMGIPSKQLHSYDYGGPYAGFRGAMNFYRDIDKMVNTRIWSFIKAPWEDENRPTLEATLVQSRADDYSHASA